ncbi:MAG: histidine--tRNA ligase [Clostridia bacterium]|nr:histidine--tRNA ligase [Clostridia bacterium]
MLTQAPKGTRDVPMTESYKWQYVEERIRRMTALAGLREVRTPMFEHTELFLRSVGDTTDVVQKEMYTFMDKGGRSITLKPEGTASVVRSFIESRLYAETLPAKMYYLSMPNFRYEKPQNGRLREFHQFGVEVFGAPLATEDAELIALAWNITSSLGVKGLELHINSIGCPECRARYYEVLREFFAPKIGGMCENCKGRFERNPMRLLDCKEEACKKAAVGAPKMIDYLCEDCSSHFETLKTALSALGIAYTVDPQIVRGLDYYTKTVFEIIARLPEGPLTVCGGGRYDHLIEEVGGPAMAGVGFGMGMERLLMVMEQTGVVIPKPDLLEVYIANYGEKARMAALELCAALRHEGIRADIDHVGRSMKAQFKYADKAGAAYVVTIGEDELDRGEIRLRQMESHEEKPFALTDAAGIAAFVKGQSNAE